MVDNGNINNDGWIVDMIFIPSGKLTVCYVLNMDIEVVDLPISNGEFPLFYVNGMMMI